MDITERQGSILTNMTYGRKYAVSEINTMLQGKQSFATLRRAIDALKKQGFLAQQGQKRGTTYHKTIPGAFFSPHDPALYFKKSEQERAGLAAYCFDALAQPLPVPFSTHEQSIFDAATLRFKEKSARSADVSARELERFVIELSWKSSQIEGNTYSLLDTERLIRDGVAAEGHSQEEMRMILNHKEAFVFTLRERPQKLTPAYIEKVHTILVTELGVVAGVRHGEVGITGTSYRPIGIVHQLREQLALLCDRVNELESPQSRALYALIGLSYLQPFADGNKRTARLIANALLLVHGCAPLSYRTTDEVVYKESMLTFYEQLSIVPMKRIFSEQYLFACEQYLRM